MAFIKRVLGALFSSPSSKNETSAIDRYRRLQARYPSDGLRTRLEAASPQRLTEGVFVAFTVANPTGERRQFCDYHTPFEGIRNTIFEVAGPGGALKYQGPVASRIPPREDNFIVLEPGQEARAEVDLRQGYDLSAGRHTIRFSGNNPSLLEEASNRIEVEVLGEG